MISHTNNSYYTPSINPTLSTPSFQSRSYRYTRYNRSLLAQSRKKPPHRRKQRVARYYYALAVRVEPLVYATSRAPHSFAVYTHIHMPHTLSEVTSIRRLFVISGDNAALCGPRALPPSLVTMRNQSLQARASAGIRNSLPRSVVVAVGFHFRVNRNTNITPRTLAIKYMCALYL